VNKLTDNHLQVLKVVARRDDVSLERITRQVTFTCHQQRVMRVLFDLRDQGLVFWSQNGGWSISPSGEQLLDVKIAS
jgi:predicted transcriptional regulator